MNTGQSFPNVSYRTEYYRTAFLPNLDAADPPHLYGNLCYRDNVEDEWLVVWLLLEISKEFPHLVIRSAPDLIT